MRKVGAWWAVFGFSLLMLWAIWRLSAVAVEGFGAQLQWQHWLVLIANVVFMAYSEGYRGFQRGYSPRLARRVAQLREAGSGLHCLLAPLYAMGFFAAPLRRMLTTYLVTLGIVALIVLFHQISQPWRGILDAGVVIGLTWGLIATWFHIAYQLNARPQSQETPP